MSAFGRWSGVVCLAAALAGCGKSESAPVAGASGPAQGVTEMLPAADGAGSQTASAPTEAPDAVVGRFLEAMRNGDKEVVGSLLTTAAREETVRLGYHINPPGDPSSKYQVGRVEMPETPGGDALVSSTWTQEIGEGEIFSYEVVWILKQESAGWRVKGLAVQDVQDAEPVVFNFENLQEVFEKKEQVEQADAEDAVRQAQNPAQGEVANPNQ